MNSRLLIPGLVLAGFGAALGLTGRDAGLWRAPAAPERVEAAPIPPPARRAPVMTPAAAAPAAVPAPVPTTYPPPDATPPPVTQDDESPPMQVQESDGFLDARDRAAGHGARSH